MYALVLYINNSEYEDEIIDVIFSLVGKHTNHKMINKYHVFYHSFDKNDELKDTLISISSEFMLPLQGYISENFEMAKLNQEVDLALEALSNLGNEIYNFKDIIRNIDDKNLKKKFLDYIIDGTGITREFIKEFAEADLNISLASKKMYIHRNTMIYKLDKFMELTGFDLRRFIDTYLLYSLI